MYTEQSIQKIRESDIVKIVQHFCPDLKRKGASYFCKSPFKTEKTPSFNVNPIKNNWVDYSTGLYGDGIAFVERYTGVEFIEACETIAGICGIAMQEEKVSEEVKRKRKNQVSLLKLARNVSDKYVQNFRNLPKTHWAKKHIERLGYSEETLIKFQIGYANQGKEITKAFIEKGILQKGLDIGVISTKNNQSYDFLQDRISFPICDKKGNTIAFGGRRQNGKEFDKYPKYLNSKETELYKKTEVLYGFHQAKQAIYKNGYAVLTEGYTDVITMHEKDCEQTVATCGTALTNEHILQLKKICERIVLFRDGDEAGVNATIRDLNLLLKAGFRVSLIELPEGEDPDSWARGQVNMTEYVQKYAIDAVSWRFNNLAEEGKKGPYENAKALNKAIEVLFCIKNEVIANHYIKELAALFKQKQTLIKNKLGELQKEATEQRDRDNQKNSSSDVNGGLPKGANQQQYLKDRFCEVGNMYYFTKGDGFFPGTNHRITPLFHIKGKKENKRLCEVVNTDNQRALVDLESDSFVSFSDFKKQLIRLGYYIFLSGTTTAHFDLVAQKILKEFNTALELQTMGWNSKGFFAFSNGVHWNNKFQEVNKYGIIHLEGVDTTEEDEYNEKVEYYYSPAYSVMHKKNQDGDDPYENDRKFIYKKSPITLAQWMNMLLEVFQEKGRIGILFNFATLFRDLFIKNYGNFPLLGGFGEKGSGKSALGKILQDFFFYNLEPLELNQATLVGFNRRLSRTTNTTIFLDEFTNKIEERMLQAMKAAYQGMGREKGMATNDKRTVYDKINSAIYYAGQYLPTWDDNSLATRTICLQFPLKNYTLNEKAAFNNLLQITSEGISSLVFEILEHRQYFEQQLPRVYSEVTRALTEALTDKEFEGRILENYAKLLITYKILSDKITIPFSYDVVFNQCVEGIIENSEAVQDSNGLTEFWNVLQWLFERRIITEGVQFKIDKDISFKIIGKQKKVEVFQNPDRKQILYLRLNSVHQDYLKEVTKREGVDPIGETTLRNYFKSRGYFIGLVKGKRFKNGVSSCYAFDYDKMLNQNIVSLETSEEYPAMPGATPSGVTMPETQPNKKEDDDLPF